MHPKICFQMLSRSGQVMGDYHHFDDQAIDKISPHRTWVHENDLDRYIRGKLNFTIVDAKRGVR